MVAEYIGSLFFSTSICSKPNSSQLPSNNWKEMSKMPFRICLSNSRANPTPLMLDWHFLWVKKAIYFAIYFALEQEQELRNKHSVLLKTQLYPTFFTSSFLLQLMLKVMTCMGIALQNKSWKYGICSSVAVWDVMRPRSVL